MSEVRISKLKFSDLVFLEDNPRKISKDKLKRLAERISEDPTFFENRPCLVNLKNGKYICYAGFQRSHVASKILKWSSVPCIIEDDVSDDVMRKRAILDNTHDGEWDSEILGKWEFSVDELQDMGVPEYIFPNEQPSKETKKETQELKPFKKTHILLSLPPQDIQRIQPFLDEILKIETVEYEQGSN